MHPTVSEDVVEGEWKNFVFKITQSPDFDRICKFLGQHYYRDELMHRLVGWSESKVEDMDCRVKAMLAHNLSIHVEDKDTCEIVGVRVAYDSRKPLVLIEQTGIKNLKAIHPRTQKIVIFKERMEQAAVDKALLEKYSGEDYAHGYLASVDPRCRGQGIATELYSRSIKQFRMNGYTLAKNYFSSPITIKIVTKLGYEELSRYYIADVKDDNGVLVFPGVSPDLYGTYMAMKL